MTKYELVDLLVAAAREKREKAGEIMFSDNYDREKAAELLNIGGGLLEAAKLYWK